MIGRTNVGGGGTGGTLTVTAPAGATVAVSKDGKTKTKVAGSDGVVAFRGLQSGTWTVKIQLGTDVAEDTVQLVTDYTKEMSFVKIYGISRDITSSSPAWARENDAVGKTATASVGTVAGSSDFDSCYPWSGIHRETLDTGDVMVKIPKFWYRRYRDGNIEHIKIADKPTNNFTLHPAFCHAGVEADCLYVAAFKTSSGTKSVSGVAPTTSISRATARTNAKSKGDGWGIVDIAALSAIQLLIMVEFADNNVQDVIGRGYSDANNFENLSSGTCDSVPNLTGSPSGTDGETGVVWRGIENFWGDAWEWIDGVNISDGQYYVCNDLSKYADNTSIDYDKLQYAMSTGIDTQYITQVGLDETNPHIMLPSAASGGSETTYYCDCCSTSSGWRVPAMSGTESHGSQCGIFTARMDKIASDGVDSLWGYRLQYIPQ